MKAAVFYGPPGAWPEKPMRIEDRTRPEPGPDEVLVKVAACGMCRTDLEYLKESPTPKAPPIILGHEPSGVIAEVGSKVKSVTPGQKVLVAFSIPCRSCQYCQSGQENLCPNSIVVGADRDGAFAEYLAVPATSIFPLPETMPLDESSIISDAVATSYHAIYNTAGVKRGDTIAIFGASGGLGLICTRLAAAAGASVIAIGRKRWKLEKAREFGAKEIISLDEVERADKAIKSLTGGGADISLDVTGVPSMIEMAVRSTRPGGKVVVVGFSFQKIQLEINRLVWLQLTVKGSRTYNPSDLPKVIKLVAGGVIDLRQVVSHRFKLEEINEAYRMLDKGEILRGIIVP
jgi:2-desacetyl-2-hydroxyethyl bacteriochlorophyllide A dehydrogenase